MSQIENIRALAKTYADDYIAVRRHLHQHPELSFQEFGTSEFLKKCLLNIGVDNIVSVAGTGILASIEGRKGPNRVLLRSDMDALPIAETNTIPYRSMNRGVMHACGHDVHMASLLLSAKILTTLKNTFSGSVKVLFQPGEEIMPGGASLVMKEKAYQDLGTIRHIGQHVRPDLRVGTVGFCEGKFMASMDELFVTVRGKGGHAAMPEAAIDPVLIASHIIVAAQQLISRMGSPKIPSVLSFGKVVADGAINILPDEVHIEGTFRTMDERWRKEALKKLEHLVVTMAESMGGSCNLKVKHGYPHLINAPDVTGKLSPSAADYVGQANIVEVDQWMASEDFAYYSQQHPSCFYVLGVGNVEQGIEAGLHTPSFNIDESAIEVGGGLMAWLACTSLG